MKINYVNGKGSIEVDDYGYIESLQVKEEFRRQGIGTKLVQMAIECKPHVTRFHAFCNEHSRGCFEKLGFKLVPYHSDNFSENGFTYTYCELVL